MTDAIKYLEMLGESPAACVAANAAAAGSLACGLQREAIARRDPAALGALLGGRASMAMHVLAPEPEEQPSRESPFREDDAPGPAEEPQEEQPE